MSTSAPSGTQRDARRSMNEALTALVESRYVGSEAEIRPLFLPRTLHDMCVFLETYAPEAARLPDKALLLLWKEVRGRHPETILVAVPSGEQGWRVHRNIRTATVRTYHLRHEPTIHNPDHYVKEFLWEFRIQKDGSLLLRPFANSFSEKLYWTELTDKQAVVRAFREECGWTGRGGHKKIAPRHLAPPYLTDLADHDQISYFKGDNRAEKFSEHESDKFPGLITVNELWHYIFNMNIAANENTRHAMSDESYYRPWYHEANTSNIFVFGDTSSPPQLVHVRDLGLTLDELGLS